MFTVGQFARICNVSTKVLNLATGRIVSYYVGEEAAFAEFLKAGLAITLAGETDGQ